MESVLEILIPTVMASLIDEGISGGSMPAILKFGLILLICSVVSLTSGFLAGKFSAIAGAGFAKNLRHDQFEKVQGYSFTNIDRFSTGSIVTRLTTDVTNLQNAYMMIIRLGVRAPIMVIVAWIFSFRISPSISLVFLACIPVLAIGLCGLAVLVHPVFERVFHTYDALNNVVDENLQGIRVVKSYNRENHETEKFNRISERIFKDFTKAERIMSFNSPLMMVCVYASMILIAWMGAQQIVASGNNAAVGLTTGDLTALVTYAMQILMAMMMLSMIFIMVIISQASAERICQVLQEESTVTDPANPVTDMADGSIEFDHVTFRYDGAAEAALNERIRADHIWLSNPVLVRGLGMAPVIGAALDGRRALMLCIASLILVTFTRVLAVAICHLTKNRFRPVVYCYSAALLYIPTYVLLYALFGSDLTLLGIYLPIMVVEPAIVKRMEFSDLEPVRDAFRHGFNNALGMCVVLLIVGCLRELLATGSVFGNVILHNALLPLAALPAGGFVIVGILAAIWCAAANLYTDYKHEEVRRLYADRKH